MDQPAPRPTSRNILSFPGTGRAETVMTVTHTYRLEEQQTGGALACIELVVAPGHGIPPHTHHREDEIFYVIEGTIEITGDDLAGPTRLPQGGIFYGPRGRLHGFRNPTDVPGRMLVFLTPGGNMQRMFAALAELTARAHGAPSPEEVGALCAGYDIIFAPPA
ncbi:MAG TPA: cupin domain-containing protein [Rhodopila sp.]|uniref:cupin domain-containing protein n=1 Tax=Rhodopila sp. TaxID=2480087 RepID=UPI002C65BC9C|nr:cupin domain-containing protein [Rhodopila sp.]HVY16182.1 cupin domain-containing protein [Rhodopila sp.]